MVYVGIRVDGISGPPAIHAYRRHQAVASLFQKRTTPCTVTRRCCGRGRPEGLDTGSAQPPPAPASGARCL